MQFVLITGPHAVGKMTVGQELSKLTGLKLFHNHMTIDLVTQFFEFSDPHARRLVDLFRREIFEAMAKSDQAGLIFTYMWAFDAPSDWAYVEEVFAIFESVGAEIYVVELEADYAMRLDRNKTENRLAHKPTKRDIEHSEKIFIHLEEKYRLNSLPGEIPYPNYLKVQNDALTPNQCAQRIYDWMRLRLVKTNPDSCDAINQLIFDSEAFWGEDEAFMAAFKAKYRIEPHWLKTHVSFSAYRQDELVGFWALDLPNDVNPEKHPVLLEYFYVEKSLIGSGIGSWLWTQLMTYCRSNGIEDLTWVTSPGAEGFYVKQGAKRIDTIQSTLRQGREIPKMYIRIRPVNKTP